MLKGVCRGVAYRAKGSSTVGVAQIGLQTVGCGCHDGLSRGGPSTRPLATSSKSGNRKFLKWETKITGSRGAGLPDFTEHWNEKTFYRFGAVGVVGASAAIACWGVSIGSGLAVVPVGVYWYLGLRDMRQKNHTILKNFPVIGRMRYFLESIRPEIRQYFVEADDEAAPFTRQQRSIVYQRAKEMTDTQPFGTRYPTYEEGYEWCNHSMFPTRVDEAKIRVTIGNKSCKQPYSASRLNVSAMSYGALSANAILALNTGAKMGNFYHNTGEGSISRFHLQPGGDLVWNIGTGYFGCRDRQTGGFDPAQFKDRVALPQVKMVEIKLSQGAKPGHGGMLPAAKITKEIAEARGIGMDKDCDSPGQHSTFSDARGLLRFVQELRDLSGSKPVGFKLCMGRPVEFATIVGAMVEMQVFPDFITLDGGEGGTGAAPPEFSNHVGFPLNDALQLTHNLLVGAGVRQHVKLIASGKIISAFAMVKTTALGADVCNSARGMLFALGCVQALKCNTNKCPTGITTQEPHLMQGLDVSDKSVRVYNFQHKTIQMYKDLVGAIGFSDPGELRPDHIMRRQEGGTYSKSYAEIFPPLLPGSLLTRDLRHPTNIQELWNQGQEVLKGRHLKSIPYSF